MEEQATPDVQQDAAADIEKNKTMGILAYILFFIPIIAARDSKFAMYHANQGLSLFIVAVASNVVAGFVPFIGGMLGALLSLAFLAFMVMGIISASKGEMKPLPLIGGINLLN
ncbi:MAG: hypothetical protein CVU79_01360 [Elusimicrobia bacterium HGW-Elusimicrobia-3]|nr:MAG: hypothetical protein CVU79_01360 [Elusimicrobia bacterium HGW-Elusimicrobia-3]